jgi:hypothetical protein
MISNTFVRSCYLALVLLPSELLSVDVWFSQRVIIISSFNLKVAFSRYFTWSVIFDYCLNVLSLSSLERRQ